MKMNESAKKTGNVKNKKNQANQAKQKKQKKSVAKKLRKTRLGFIPMASCLIIIALLSVHLWNNWVMISKKNEQIEAMEQEYNHRRIKNDEKQQQADAPIDDEYIMEIARRNGYRCPDEILFYLNNGE